ncbi:MAG: purine phosphorylase [Kiloniellaceae bacterium]
MTRFAVVTGLAAEARLIQKAHARAGRAAPGLACAGASGARARAHAARLIAEGAEAVISFGLCGGLDPALRPGDLVLAEEIATSDGRKIPAHAPTRARLLERLEAAGLRPAGGALLGSDRPVAKAAEKAALYATTRARAVDMESHGVALAAEAAGVPVAALRAVADPAERDLPRAALKATGPDGRLRLLAVLATMYLRPWEGPATVRLAYEARLAFDTLERVAGLSAELFGGD